MLSKYGALSLSIMLATGPSCFSPALALSKVLPVEQAQPAPGTYVTDIEVTGVKPGAWNVYVIVEPTGKEKPTAAEAQPPQSGTTDKAAGQPQTPGQPGQPAGQPQTPGQPATGQPGQTANQPPNAPTGPVTPQELTNTVNQLSQQIQKQQQELMQQIQRQQQQQAAQLQQQMAQQNQQLQQQAAQQNQQLQQQAAQVQNQLQQQQAVAREAFAAVQQRIDLMNRNVARILAGRVPQDRSKEVLDAINRMMVASAMQQARGGAQQRPAAAGQPAQQAVTPAHLNQLATHLEQTLTTKLSEQMRREVVNQMQSDMNKMQSEPPRPLTPVNIKATDYERVAATAEQVAQGDIQRLKRLLEIALEGAAQVANDEFSIPTEVEKAKEFALHLADRFRQLKDRVSDQAPADKTFRASIDEDIKNCLKVYQG